MGQNAVLVAFTLSLIIINITLIVALLMSSVARGDLAEQLRIERRHTATTRDFAMLQNISMTNRLAGCEEISNELLQTAQTAALEDEKGFLTFIVVVPREVEGDGAQLVTLVDSFVRAIPSDVLQKENTVIRGALSSVIRLRIFYFDSQENYVAGAKIAAHMTAAEGTVYFERLHTEQKDPGASVGQQTKTNFVERQYTRDVVEALRHLKDRITYGVLLSVENSPCPAAFELSVRAASLAPFALPDWTSIRISDISEIMIFRRRELEVLADFLYFRQHTDTLPALFSTYFLESAEKGGRFNAAGAAVYKYNLFSKSPFDCLKPIGQYNSQCSTEMSPCVHPSVIHLQPIFDPHSAASPVSPIVIPGRAESRNFVLEKSFKKHGALPPTENVPILKVPDAAPTNAPLELAGSTGDVKITVLSAAKGVNCNAACASQGLFCDESKLGEVNNCDWMQKYFQCKLKSQCDENEGDDQPAYDDSTGLCLIKRRKIFNCGGSHPKTQRLCSCSNDKSIKSLYPFQRNLKK